MHIIEVHWGHLCALMSLDRIPFNLHNDGYKKLDNTETLEL